MSTFESWLHYKANLEHAGALLRPEQHLRVLGLGRLARAGHERRRARAGHAEDLVAVAVQLLELGPERVLQEGLLGRRGSERL